MRLIASRTSLLTLALFAVTGAVHAQTLEFIKGTWSTGSSADVPFASDSHSDSGSSSVSSFSTGSHSYAEYYDVDYGDHKAEGSSSLNWIVSSNRIDGGTGAVAWGETNFYDVTATSYAVLDLDFKLNSDAILTWDNAGVFGSDLLMWNGSSWDYIFAGMNSPDSWLMQKGLYRWHSGSGQSISGYSWYGDGNSFYFQAEAVPEPATMVALGAGALAFIRRRRS